MRTLVLGMMRNSSANVIHTEASDRKSKNQVPAPHGSHCVICATSWVERKEAVMLRDSASSRGARTSGRGWTRRDNHNHRAGRAYNSKFN